MCIGLLVIATAAIAIPTLHVETLQMHTPQDMKTLGSLIVPKNELADKPDPKVGDERPSYELADNLEVETGVSDERSLQEDSEAQNQIKSNQIKITT